MGYLRPPWFYSWQKTALLSLFQVYQFASKISCRMVRPRCILCLETEGALSADRAPQATFQCDGLAATETPGDPAEDVAHLHSEQGSSE